MSTDPTPPAPLLPGIGAPPHVPNPAPNPIPPPTPVPAVRQSQNFDEKYEEFL